MNALKVTFGQIYAVFSHLSVRFSHFSINNLAIFRVNIKNGCFRVANRLIMAVVKSLVLD